MKWKMYIVMKKMQNNDGVKNCKTIVMTLYYVKYVFLKMLKLQNN